VKEVCGLFADCLDDSAIAMANVNDANPGGEVDETIAIHVLDDSAFAFGDKNGA